MYVIVCTRPNLTQDVRAVCKFLSNPGDCIRMQSSGSSYT